MISFPLSHAEGAAEARGEVNGRNAFVGEANHLNF